MSTAGLGWLVTWTLVTVLACVRLLRASNQPEPSVRNGYRWLAVAAICLGLGGTMQHALGGLIGGVQPLRLADLISLAALPALVFGLATLTSQVIPGEPGPPSLARPRREPANGAPPAPGGPPGSTAMSGWSGGLVLDSCLLVSALFVICLVTAFWPEYAASSMGRAAFALVLIRPVGDLVAVGLLLPFVLRSPRLTVLPVLALGMLVVGDAMAAGSRAAGVAPGAGPAIALVIALALLGLAPATRDWPVLTTRSQPKAADAGPGHGQPSGTWSSPATIAALVAAGLAALVVAGYALGGARVTTRVLAIAGSIVVLLLVARLAGLARHASAVAASAQESDWMFRALADAASDVIMICDLAGTVEYVSHSVTEFGYSPDQLIGKRLADLVHPQDRLAGIRAAVIGLRTAAGTATFAGRVRGADGSWRYIESGLSRYGKAGEPVRLLITAHDVSDRVALRRELTHLTFHDGLTGLPNRAYVEDRIKDLARDAVQALAGGPDQGEDGLVAAVILVDFDGYAAVNELVGEAGGDLVLAQAARRLRLAVPPPATVARWGGDEFAILVADATPREVVDLAERLAGHAGAEPFTVAGKEVTLTASVGVAMCAATQAEQLVGQALTALSQAQEAGTGRVEVFEPQMHADALRRIELAAELRDAIAGQRLEITYEPVAELATGLVRDVEAHVSWPRPDEVITAGALRAIAEGSGLAAQLRDWLLREACRQVASWRAQGRQVGLSVNCTLAQLSGARLVPSVLAALDEADLPPQALTLEIAEQELIACTATMVADLAGLRGKGIRLAVDSFGTGYVSLAYLSRWGVDVVKIDSSLIAGLATDQTLALVTKTIVGFAADLGIEAIAAGIATAEQAAALVAIGCGLGQGPAVAATWPAGDAEPLPAEQAGDTACTPAG